MVLVTLGVDDTVMTSGSSIFTTARIKNIFAFFLLSTVSCVLVWYN